MRPIGDSLLPLRTHVTGYGWVRLLPMAGAVGFVGLLHVPQVEPSAWDWLIAVASAAAVPAGGRRPVPVVLAQCVLLVAGVRAPAPSPSGREGPGPSRRSPQPHRRFSGISDPWSGPASPLPC